MHGSSIRVPREFRLKDYCARWAGAALCRDFAKASECCRHPEPPDAPEQAPLSLPRKRGRFYSTALARLPIVAELGH